MGLGAILTPLSTPAITLTVTLEDFSGNEIGSAASPAYVRIMLCGYGPFLPRVNGNSMIGKVTSYPPDIPYLGTPISINLWGNDVITPGGTYYAISILDANRNVIQTGTYVFGGSGTFDLSTLTPTPPPKPTAQVISNLVIVSYSSNPTFNAALLNGIVVFDITLAGPVLAPILTGVQAGQVVIFIIAQNNVGGFNFVWPTQLQNAGVVNLAANSVTTQAFVARANGNLYPLGPQTWS